MRQQQHLELFFEHRDAGLDTAHLFAHHLAVVEPGFGEQLARRVKVFVGTAQLGRSADDRVELFVAAGHRRQLALVAEDCRVAEARLDLTKLIFE